MRKIKKEKGLATEDFVKTEIGKIKPVQNITYKIENGKEDTGNCLYITKDIDLKGGEYVFEKGQDVIFRGGRFLNGTLIGDNTQLVTNEFDCFRNVKFKGTWRLKTMSICNFGAVPNAHPEDGAINDIYSSFMEAKEAGFAIHNSSGSFFTSKPIVLDEPMEIQNVGGFEPDLIQEHKYDWNKRIYGNKQTVFYTDKNQDVFVIKCPKVYMYRGMVDTSNLAFHNKAAFRYDVSFPIWGARLRDIAINGNKETLSEIGNGTIGILIDSKNAFDTFPRIGGWLHMAEFTGTMEAVGIGVYKNEFNPEYPNVSVNSLHIDFNIRNYKQAYNLEHVDVSYLGGVMQEEYNVTKEEIYPVVRAGGQSTEIDVFVMDMMHGKTKNGLYTRTNPFEITKKGVHMGPKSIPLINYMKTDRSGIIHPQQE